ncbi:urease accessory protein UreE [Terrilactibacillus laevilacticus]|uniref:urease accessory protein UreE n=1 Tax=Terrilactibacillus laevilacticus TaxID=1380157 RepID=UPI001146D42C|nr:urease accessory protein UreE [Terrilactibacillus laevilacticus]
MIIEKVIGNIEDWSIDDKKGKHVEKVYLESSDLLKRVQRVKTDHGREIGIRLPQYSELHVGDILFQDDHNMIVVDVLPDEIISILPRDIEEMGTIAHQLGNRHLPAQFEGAEMYVQYDYLVEELLEKLGIPFEKRQKKLKQAFKHIGHTHG